jgi:hypothetical protein
MELHEDYFLFEADCRRRDFVIVIRTSNRDCWLTEVHKSIEEITKDVQMLSIW